jgi:hypothetical protein
MLIDDFWPAFGHSITQFDISSPYVLTSPILG